MTQASLLCGCGGAVGCPVCRRRARLNRERFGGEREAVLRRDDYQCQACGELRASLVVVHHRRPGSRQRRHMITLCRSCHARAHFLYRPSFGVALDAPLLYALWRELHRGQPEQLILLAPPPAATQRALEL